MANLSFNASAQTAGPSGQSASVHRSDRAPASAAPDRDAQQAAKVLAGMSTDPTTSDDAFIDDDSSSEDQAEADAEPEAHLSDITDSSDYEVNSAEGDNEASDPTFVPLRRSTRSQRGKS